MGAAACTDRPGQKAEKARRAYENLEDGDAPVQPKPTKKTEDARRCRRPSSMRTGSGRRYTAQDAAVDDAKTGEGLCPQVSSVLWHVPVTPPDLGGRLEEAPAYAGGNSRAMRRNR